MTTLCLVSWDGASSKWSSPWAADEVDIQIYVRKVIVRGGSSPHRRIPEHFVLVLTRFVKEKIGASARNDLQIELFESREVCSLLCRSRCGYLKSILQAHDQYARVNNLGHTF